MEKRIGPWINKKIVEYIGEEEETLTEFICNKVLLDIFSHCFCSLCVCVCVCVVLPALHSYPCPDHTRGASNGESDVEVCVC